jgi:hypothetical protein
MHDADARETLAANVQLDAILRLRRTHHRCEDGAPSALSAPDFFPPEAV